MPPASRSFRLVLLTLGLLFSILYAIGVVPLRPHPYRPHSWFLSRHNICNTFDEYLKLAAYSLGIR